MGIIQPLLWFVKTGIQITYTSGEWFDTLHIVGVTRVTPTIAYR